MIDVTGLNTADAASGKLRDERGAVRPQAVDDLFIEEAPQHVAASYSSSKYHLFSRKRYRRGTRCAILPGSAGFTIYAYHASAMPESATKSGSTGTQPGT